MIGQIAEWTHGESGGYVVTLTDGQEIVISAAATLLSKNGLGYRSTIPPIDPTFGDLLLYGSDELGELYAVGENDYAVPEPPTGFETTGGAYEEGRNIHMSSGLLLTKAAGFDDTAMAQLDWTFPLRDGDRIVLDREGQVTEVRPFLER